MATKKFDTQSWSCEYVCLEFNGDIQIENTQNFPPAILDSVPAEYFLSLKKVGTQCQNLQNRLGHSGVSYGGMEASTGNGRAKSQEKFLLLWNGESITLFKAQ